MIDSGLTAPSIGEAKDGQSDAAGFVLNGGSHIHNRRYLVSRAGASQVGHFQSESQTGERLWCYASGF